MLASQVTSDTYAMLSETYGGEDMTKLSIFEWHELFKECHENVEFYEKNVHQFLSYEVYRSL
jgi:hypothetical protein